MNTFNNRKNNRKLLMPGELKVAYIIGTYPSLTTTFIDREINILRQWGVELHILSIRRSTRTLSPEQEALQQEVTYMLPVALFTLLQAHIWFFLKRPIVYWITFFYLLSRPHPTLKSRLKTIFHFGEGVYAAYLLRKRVFDLVHAHFVDRATIVALIVSRCFNVPYSATAHANDIYVNPVMLPEKVAGAKFLATCTNYNKSYLESVLGTEASSKVRCIYHGLDIQQYQPQPHSLPEEPVLISVGQLKEKKGFTYLISACRLLKERGYDFRCEIVGEGPLRSELEEQIHQFDLDNHVKLCGVQPHDIVIEKYKRGTIFVLPCVLSADGDRDGIPNVILEAMAMELPVVSTRHSGIPEVVEDGINGLLVPPEKAESIADALATLLDDPVSRKRYGQNGRKKIMAEFLVESNVNKLLKEFLV